MKTLKTASIDITYNCNLRCKHCFNSSGEHIRKTPEMSDETILRLSEELFDLGIENLCICGGEPMLRSALIYKIASLKSRKYPNINLSMVSNGLMIGKEEAKQLAASGINHVQISVDGNKESHEWMRNRKGSYDKAILAITNLIENGISVAVSFCPTKRNFNDIFSVIDKMHDLGVKNFRSQPLMNLGRTKIYLKNEFLSYSQYMRLKKNMDRKQREYDDGFEIEWGDPLEHLFYFVSQEETMQNIEITSYGDILISPYLPISFGNIINGSIEDYLTAGLKSVWKLPVLKKIVSFYKSAECMDSSCVGLPEIYVDDIIQLDLLLPGWEEKVKNLELILEERND